MEKERGIAHLLLVVVFCLVTLVALVYYSFQNGLIKITPQQSISPTSTKIQDETANWKTYTNSKYGFSIKYPGTPTENQTRYIYLFGVNFAKPGASDTLNPDDIWVYVQEGEALEIEQTIIAHQRDGEIVNQADIEKDGYKGYRLDYQTGKSNFPDYTYSQNKTAILLIKGNFTYIIHASTSLIDQILSTFRFIE